MPLYSIEGPGGKTYEIEGPENATRDQVIQAIQAKLTPEQPSAEDALEDYLQARADAENAKRTALGRGFRRSVDLTGEGIGSALEGVGSVLGLEGLEEYGAEMALENEAQLQRAEASATRRQDVEGLGTGLSYFGETLAESSVPMGVGIGTGALTGALVGGGIPGALIGAGAAALSQLPLFYGWNRQRQKEAIEQGIKTEVSEGAAFLSAIPQAAAEGIVDRLLVGGFFATPLMKQGGVLTRIGKGSVRGAAAEVPTEIGQQVIERAQAGLSLTSDEAISEYIDAGVAAGMIGSTVGAAGNIRATTPEMREEARRTAAQEKIARLETEVEPDPTDEILAIQGPPEMQGPPDRPTALPAPGTPAVIRVDTEGKAKTSEELSVERDEGIKIAERARQEIRRTGEVSSKTMQDLRNANIPLESVSKVLEQTRMEPSLAKPLKGEADADIGEPITTGSRASVQDVISTRDDKDAKEPDAPEEARVDSPEPSVRPAVDTEVTGDDTLEVTPKEGEAAVDFLARKREAEKTKTPVEEEPIFKDETVTSLSALTRNQQANLDVVARKLEAGEISRAEANQRAVDIKTGRVPAQVQTARELKTEEVQAAEIKRDEAQLAEIAVGEQAGLDASARKDVEKQASLESINATKAAFDKQDKRGRRTRLQRYEEEFSTVATDPYDRGTKGGALDSSDLKKVQDLVTGATLPKSNPLFKVQERLRKAPYPADVLLDDAPHEISAKVKRTQKSSTKDPKTGKETVTELDAALNERMQNSVEASALSIEKWVNENLSEKAKEKFAAQKREEVRTLKAQADYIKRRKTSEDQVIINDNNINIENERAKFEAGEITEAQLNKNIDRIREKSALKKLPLDSVSNLDTPMHPVVVEMLAAGNLEAALKGLSITSQSKRVSALAKVLANNIGTTKLEIVEDLDSAGVFDPRTNTISLNSTEGLNTHTLLHEMIHAVVSAKLSDKSNPTTAQLNTLFKKVKGLIPTARGSTNLDEFVSEAMSNPEFQSTLASINIQGEPVSVYRRFMNIIANFGRKLVGAPTVSLTYIPNINDSLKGLDVFSAIDTLVQGDNLFDALIAPAPEYRNADMLLLNATAGGVNEMAKAFGTIQKKINSYDGVKSFGNSMFDILKNLRKSPRVGILKILGTQALADVAEKAGFGKLAENLHIAIEEQRGAMMESDAALDVVMRDLANFRKDNPKLKVVMDKLIYDADYGSTINQVDPLLSQADAEAQYLRYKFEYLNDKGDLKTKSFKTKKDRDAEYKKFTDPKYEAEKLNPESEKMDIWKLQQKELNKLNPADRKKLLAQYTALRNTYRNMYEKLKDVLFGRVDAALAEDPDAAKKLKSSVFKKIFRANTLAVYFPLTREGNFKLTYAYKSVDEAPESEANPSYVVRMFKSETERDRAAAEIRKDNKFERVETSDGDFKEAHFENAPSFSFVGKTLDALKKGDVKEDVRTEIVQLFIDTLPETSFAKSFKKRENIEGFIEDSLDAFRIKAYDLGRQTERLVHGKRIKDIEQQISGLKVPDPAAMKAESIVGRGTEAITASFADLKKELLQRGGFARNPPSEPLMKKANQFAFIYTIGFNVSSAIVNTSQVPLFVLPYLGAKYGYQQSASDLTNAGRLVGGAKNNILAMYDRNEQGDYVVKSDIPKNLKAEYELMKPAVQMAAKRGLLTTSFLKDALGLDESGRKRTIGDSISSMSAFFFNHAERFNRQTTILGGYNLELEKLMGKYKPNDKQSRTEYLLGATTEQKTAAAKEAIRQAQETNGGAVLETAPALTQKGIGRVAFMYKSYGLQMYYTMLKSAKTMMDSDMNAEQRKIAAKQLAGVHGTALFFAGVHGVPLYGAFSVLYNLLIAGEDDDDFDTVVRKTIGEGWYKGVPAMSGIDPSNRIRLTGLLLQENKFDRNADLEGLIGFHLGGPFLSSAKRIQRGAKDLYNGELMRGTESLLPAGVANMMKAFPFIGRIDAEGGYKTRRGDIIYDDVNVLERAGQFLGFAPTGYMLEQERNNIIKGIDTAISKKRSKLLKQYYVAKRMGDFDGARDVRKEMRAFSKKHKEAAITAETIDRSMKQHAKTSLEMYNGIRLNPQMRETLKDSRNDWDRGLRLFD
jgi:hypothetical protein